jgi:hypothetical protein
MMNVIIAVLFSSLKKLVSQTQRFIDEIGIAACYDRVMHPAHFTRQAIITTIIRMVG